MAGILAVLDNKATSARKLSLARFDICGLSLNSTEDALRGILSGVFRGQDLVGQFSATEFLLLSDELDGTEMAQSINIVRRAFEERYGREGTLLVGIATLEPGHNSVEELLARAEQSLQDDRRQYQVEGLLGLSRVLGSSVSVQSESTLSPGLWKV